MAGHSQFKNIMHRKGAQDAKRAKVFAKLIREITVAARAGLPDPNANPRLRAGVLAALKQNMTRDAIDRAIKKAAGAQQGDDYFEVRYEGYGPGGTAVIVEALTDNRNRTASAVRSYFTKSGGAMGESNSVSFMFNRVGEISYAPEVGDADKVMEAALGREGNRFVYVGDNPAKDFVAPNARGWTTVQVKRDTRGIHDADRSVPGGDPQHRIASLAELPALLGVA